MNYWLHRISHHAELSYPLLEDRKILSTGWSGFSEESYLEECIDNWDRFEERFDLEWKRRPRNRYYLWHFISEMKKGDYVLIPRWWGEFAVYEIMDERPFSVQKLDLTGLKDWGGHEIIMNERGYLCRKNEKSEEGDIDLGFFRRVEPVVKKASRNDYVGQGLTSRMKFRGTTACINDLESNVERAIQRVKSETPINLQSSILDGSVKSVLDLIHDQLNDAKFEHLIKWYFEKAGASNG